MAEDSDIGQESAETDAASVSGTPYPETGGTADKGDRSLTPNDDSVPPEDDTDPDDDSVPPEDDTD
ncbi:MAG TPA: hypothetical protein VM490_18920, partial [Armatimonadaceae bacterium]|nr:hypothetical protein [Armatimonadaceae bacterium]